MVWYVGDRNGYHEMYICPDVITLVVVPYDYPVYFYVRISSSLVEYLLKIDISLSTLAQWNPFLYHSVEPASDD